MTSTGVLCIGQHSAVCEEKIKLRDGEGWGQEEIQ